MNLIIIILMVLTFISRIIGMGREMTLAYFFGATYISDAYLMSIAIPTIIVTFIIVSVATSYIPIYQKLPSEVDVGLKFTNKVIGFSFLLCIAILIFSLLFTPLIVSLFVSGFDPDALELTVDLTRLTLLAIFFMTLNHILNSFLQVKEKVLLASLSGLPFNIISIIFIIISARIGVQFLAYGTIAAIGIQTIYLLILAYFQGFKLKPIISIKDKNIKNLIILAMPIMLANGVEQVGIIVDKNLASGFGPGAVSALSYATRTTTAISGIVITSFLIVTFPKIAKYCAKREMKSMKLALSESIVGMSLFIIPAIIAITIFAQPVISLLFGRGAFDDVAVVTTSNLLLFYVYFLFGNGLTQLFSRVFFALEDSKTPMIVSTITVILNIIFNLIFTSFMGISGLALATSASSMIGLCLIVYLLRRKIGVLALKNAMTSLFKIFGASLAMSFIAFAIFEYLLPFAAGFSLIISAIIGVGIYIILLLFARIPEVEHLIGIIFNYLKKFLKV